MIKLTRRFSALHLFLAMVLFGQFVLSGARADGDPWPGLAQNSTVTLKEVEDAEDFLSEAKSKALAAESFAVAVATSAHRLDPPCAAQAHPRYFAANHSRDPPRT